MKALFTFIFLLFIGLQSFAQDSLTIQPKSGKVQTLSTLSFELLEQNKNLKKLNILLKAKEDHQIKPGNLILGTSVTGLVDYQNSNTESKFGYLMRHPTANNQRTKSVSEAVIHSAQLSFMGGINSWITLYSEFLYNPEQSFGQGSITALNRNLVQLRKGIILLADPNKTPVYLAIGKMDGNFGQSGSVSPFTNSTMWHAFGTLAYGAVLGYSQSGLNASLMLIQGGAQFRAANVPVDGTNIPSKLNNLSFDIHYSYVTNDVGFKLGVSYLKGSPYVQAFPVTHFSPGTDNNPAYSIYGSANISKIQLKASYANTIEPWPGTHNPNPPLNEFEASKVSSLSIGAGITLKQTDEMKYSISGEFSNFIAGPEGSPWERQNQIILGFSSEFNSSSTLFLELFNTRGYAPLNFISGGNLDDPGTTHSDRDARSTGIILGGIVTL